MTETAFLAKNIHGDSLYQQRACEAFPLLVRQAEAQESITYSALAAELRMPNPRNLNYVLGSVGTTLAEMAQAEQRTIPPLTLIVVNQQTGLPGESVNEFIADQDFTRLSRKQQRILVDAILQDIYAYPHWREILRHLALTPYQPTNAELLQAAAVFRGSGESEHHLAFKRWLHDHPEQVNLPKCFRRRTLECPLPSGDVVDILFEYADEWVAVEAKSRISGEADLVRGLYQCVKYRALIEAYQSALGLRASGRAILALEGIFPEQLLPLKHVLGIEVVDGLRTAEG